MMHGAFDNTEAWSSMYQRNNKRTGLKNVRCFPFCSEQHIEKGFCGRPVILRLSRYRDQQSEPVFSWGEFRRADEPRDVDVNTILSGDEIRSRTKDPKSAKMETLNAPYFEGVVEGGDKHRMSPTVKFVFNQRKKGWNYAWQASKHTAKARHAFFAYVFVEEANDRFRCIGVYVSPTFILYCRKRKPDGGGGGGGAGVLDDDDDDDDDDDLEDLSAKKPSKRVSSSSAGPATAKAQKKRRSAINFGVANELDAFDPKVFENESRKKLQSLDPITIPDYHENGSGLGVVPKYHGGGGLGSIGAFTPLTSFVFGMSGIGDEDSGSHLSSSRRSSMLGTPSSISGDDSDEIDFEAANQLDPTVVARVAAVLNRLHSSLTADDSAETLGLPQFAVDWFVSDLEQVADLNGDLLNFNFGGVAPPTGAGTSSSSADATVGISSTETPRTLFPPTPLDIDRDLFEPLDWSQAKPDIIAELTNYLLEESTVTASIRQIIAQEKEGRLTKEARLREFIKMVEKELSNFLAKRGYTERELDEALKEDAEQEPSKTLKSLDDHVERVVATQKRLDSAKAQPSFSWLRTVTVRPELDLSGHWRLDDTLLNAFEEIRTHRGIPYMIRRILRMMESKVVVTHSPDRVVIALKTKLLASPEVCYELDGHERVWDVAPPVPWHSKLCEIYSAWIEDGALSYRHVYSGTRRTTRTVRKNASGDRFEMDVLFEELDPLTQTWQVILQRKGYGLRIATVDY